MSSGTRQAIDMAPNDKFNYEIRGRECSCEDPAHGTQTFKLFSITKDMPLGMWLSNGKFHKRDDNVSKQATNLDEQKQTDGEANERQSGSARENVPLKSLPQHGHAESSRSRELVDDINEDLRRIKTAMMFLRKQQESHDKGVEL